MDFDMDSIKSTLGLDDGGSTASPASDSGGGGALSQAWNAVSDGASQAWNSVSDTASSAATAVGDGASSLMSTASADASAVWNTVSNGVSDGAGAVMDKIKHPFGAPQDDGPIVVPMDNRPLDSEGHSPDQAQWIKDHPKSPYELQKEQEEKNVRTNSARDAGFDDSQHMQDYIAAKQKWQQQVDDFVAKKGPQPQGLDDYMRQQHLRGPSQSQKAQRQADHDYMPGQ
jgi:hypothetical protein